MFHTQKIIFFSLPALALLSACGKASKMPEFASAALPVDGSNINGAYVAELQAINPSVSNNKGSATIYRKGEKITAMVRMLQGAPYAWHPQKVYLGSRCPTPKDDLNQDGFIDAKEGEVIWGQAIIPLDGDLSGQDAGKNLYPSSGSSGDYFYKKSANFNTFFADLKELDPNYLDNTVKLSSNAGLSINGAVIVIQGTDEWANLPDTVASVDSMDKHKSLPVACGVFKKMFAPPEESDLPQVEPVPEPTPETEPAPGPDTDLPSSESPEEEEDWVDRVVEWWRERWRGITGR